MQRAVTRQRIRGLAAHSKLWCLVLSLHAILHGSRDLHSSLLVLATRPPMNTSAQYTGIAPGIPSLGAACQRGVGARKRGTKTALWWASHTWRRSLCAPVPFPSGPAPRQLRDLACTNPHMVVPQSLCRLIDGGGDDHLRDAAILGVVHLHQGA